MQDADGFMLRKKTLDQAGVDGRAILGMIRINLGIFRVVDVRQKILWRKMVECHRKYEAALLAAMIINWNPAERQDVGITYLAILVEIDESP